MSIARKLTNMLAKQLSTYVTGNERRVLAYLYLCLHELFRQRLLSGKHHVCKASLSQNSLGLHIVIGFCTCSSQWDWFGC